MLELVGGSLYQWDLDRKMIVTDETTVSEIHFANIGDSMALQVEPKEVDGQTIVNIPNELLQTSRNLVAYVFVDNQTVQKFIFEVNSRPKPAGYVYTESEILKWNSLDDRIKALEESGGGVEDYDQLINTPIKNVKSDQENMVAIRDLASGVYRLSGSFTPFTGSDIYLSFSNLQLVNIVTKSAGTHMQIFYPVNNVVQFVAIMADENADGGYTYERKDIKLNDLYDLIGVTIPTKTSELDNDSGFLTSAPVSSVNGKTGNVEINADDIGAATTDYVDTAISTAIGNADTLLGTGEVTT